MAARRLVRVSDALKQELVTLNDEKGGRMTPGDVLSFAKGNKTSETYHWLKDHNAFNKEKAAIMWQELLCRQLIMRVKVSVLTPEKTVEKVRAFVSLVDERAAGGGYRQTIAVLSDDDLTLQLMETAQRELQAFTRKYEKLRHLEPMKDVFKAIDTATI